MNFIELWIFLGFAPLWIFGWALRERYLGHPSKSIWISGKLHVEES